MIITMIIEFKELEKMVGPFDRRPILLKSEDNAEYGVEFGNTGFKIRLVNEGQGKVGRFDFTPESKYDPTSTPARYAKMLGASLYGLWEWLKNPPLDQKIISGQFHSIKAITNENMIRAITNLFSANGHGEMIGTSRVPGTEFNAIEINLDLLKELEESDMLIKKLFSYDEMCREMEVSFHK